MAYRTAFESFESFELLNRCKEREASMKECKNCGAPLKTTKCKYCGSSILIKNKGDIK